MGNDRREVHGLYLRQLNPMKQVRNATVTTPIAHPPRIARPSRRKALGQHFLVDRRIARRVVEAAELSSEDTVVEVGPGRGALTRELVARVGRVIAIEMDPQLADSLPLHLHHPPNLTVIAGDAREVELTPLLGDGGSYKVVANLPYYAANPIIRRFLERAPKPSLLVVMVQREVARRMMASPGQMGLLSVAVQLYSLPKSVCTVPPRAFVPPPKVTSAVLRLDLFSRPAVDVQDVDGFFTVVRAGFSAPRKQLRNSLSHGLGISGEQAEGLLRRAEIDPSRRPATVSLEEWERLYRVHQKP